MNAGACRLSDTPFNERPKNMSKSTRKSTIPPQVAPTLTRDDDVDINLAPIATPGMRVKAYVDCSAYPAVLLECGKVGATVRFTGEKPDECDGEAMIPWHEIELVARQQLQDSSANPILPPFQSDAAAANPITPIATEAIAGEAPAAPPAIVPGMLVYAPEGLAIVTHYHRHSDDPEVNVVVYRIHEEDVGGGALQSDKEANVRVVGWSLEHGANVPAPDRSELYKINTEEPLKCALDHTVFTIGELEHSLKGGISGKRLAPHITPMIAELTHFYRRLAKLHAEDELYVGPDKGFDPFAAASPAGDIWNRLVAPLAVVRHEVDVILADAEDQQYDGSETRRVLDGLSDAILGLQMLAVHWYEENLKLPAVMARPADPATAA